MTIYACNIDVTGNPIQPDKTDVEALSGVEELTLSTYGLYAALSAEMQEYNKWNGVKITRGVSRGTYSIQALRMNFPNSPVSIQDFYPLYKIIDKRNVWIYTNDYNIQPHEADKVLKVNIDTAEYVDDGNGGKLLTINCSEIKPNLQR